VQAEGTFKEGQREGIFTSWHPNGNKYKEACFKDGAEIGVAKFWDENGNPTVHREEWRPQRHACLTYS
jgi:antitoxin component YwqK of YwqJK toxin-antitoxin module